MLKALARFILRNELAILKEDVEIANSNTDYEHNRAEAYYHRFFKLNDELEQTERELKERIATLLLENKDLRDAVSYANSVVESTI